MRKFNYIGSSSEIDGVLVLDKYGQAFELEEKLAEDVIACIPFLPAADFSELGHFADELKAHQYGAASVMAPEFRQKYIAGQLRLSNIRERVAVGGSLIEESLNA